MDEHKIEKAIEAFKTAEKIAKDFYNQPLVQYLFNSSTIFKICATMSL